MANCACHQPQGRHLSLAEQGAAQSNWLVYSYQVIETLQEEPRRMSGEVGRRLKIVTCLLLTKELEAPSLGIQLYFENIEISKETYSNWSHSKFKIQTLRSLS